ncbi:MAG: hypothetical protein WB580_16075 [Candidatus Binataceae bacterium]
MRRAVAAVARGRVGAFDTLTFALLNLGRAGSFGRGKNRELSQMDGGLFGGVSLTWPTLIRLAMVLVLAIAVRQLILRFGTKAIDSRRDKSRNGKPRR